MVVRGWRDWRPQVIDLAISYADFNPNNPPKDLYSNIEEIYGEQKVAVGIAKIHRFHEEGQKWSYILRISCHFGSRGSWEVHGELVADFRITCPAEKYDVDIGITVGRDPMSAPAINITKTWLDTCLAKHQTCLSPTPTGGLPSRYLDVNDAIRNDHIFLRDSGVEPDYRYVALSHCWGPVAEQLCTTSATLQNHKEGIPIQILPQTFKDAVQVVRELGLRYLWIDSLCIIQDDIEDWREESEKMTEVYRNAHLVLAAARSVSDSEGFLSPRTMPERVELESKDGTCFNIEAMPFVLVPVYGAHPIDKEPLSRRAWCLQECYLARRVLFHGSQQMYWECGEIHAAENGDFGSVVGDQLWRVRRSAAAETSVFTGTSKDDYMNYSDWYRMIKNYTGRDITKDSDRLPALFGLAKALEAQTGDKYLNGIWLKGLLEGLMWCSVSADNLLSRPKKSSAPSWAWASVKGQIQFPIYPWYIRKAAWKGSKANFEPLAEYVHQAIQTCDDILPNQSELHICAPIVPIQRFKQRRQTPPDSGSRFGLAPERSLVADQTFYFQCHHPDIKTRNVGIDGAFDIKEEEQIINTDRLYIVFLTRLPLVFESDFLEHRFGLIVEKHETAEKFKRVGFVDGCLISEGLSDLIGEWLSKLWDQYVPQKWNSDNPAVCAFKRDHTEGDSM